MRYLSPASLPDGSQFNPSDKKSLQLQKKKLLAEIELSTEGELRINDQTFSKNDILAYFDSLEDENIISYHEAIGKDKTLVRFLETGRLTDRTAFAQATLYSDARFLQWISPYFYIVFTGFVYRCLENTDIVGLETILQNPLLLTDQDRENAWLKIGQMLEDNIDQLDHYHEQDKKKPTLSVDDLDVLITKPLTRMILLFPETPFSGIRDKYAFAIMQVCIYTYNNDKAHRKHIDPWMENAKALAASERMADELASKHQEIKKLREKSRQSTLFRGAFLLIFILVKFIPGSNYPSPSNSQPPITTFSFHADTIHNTHSPDSVTLKRWSADSTVLTTPQIKQ